MKVVCINVKMNSELDFSHQKYYFTQNEIMISYLILY